MSPISIDELSRGAHAIVTGTVIEQESQYSVEHTTIYTYVTVQIEQNLKNTTKRELSEGATIILRLPGGVVEDIGIGVEDTPAFKLDERVFLFLDVDRGLFPAVPEEEILGDFVVHGWVQGKYTILGDMIQVRDRMKRANGEMLLNDFIADIRKIVSAPEELPSYLEPEKAR